MKSRVELTSDQTRDIGALVEGRFSTNESVLDLNGRDESAFPPIKPSAVVMAHSTEGEAKVHILQGASKQELLPGDELLLNQ